MTATLRASQALEKLTDRALKTRDTADVVRAWEEALRVCERLGIVGGRPCLEVPHQVRQECGSFATSWSEGTHTFTRLCFQCSRLTKSGLYTDSTVYDLSRHVMTNMAPWLMGCLAGEEKEK